MTVEIGTSGGNKAVQSAAIGTAGGVKAVSEIWVGTAGGNKQVFSAMSVTAFQPNPAIPYLYDPDGIPSSGDEVWVMQTQAHCTVTGGVAPYSFLWSGDGNVISFEPDNIEDTGVIFVPPVANVAVTVSDANGNVAVSNSLAIS